MVIMPVQVCLLRLPLNLGSLDLAYLLINYARSLNTFDVQGYALEATINAYDSFYLRADGRATPRGMHT